MRSLRIWVWNNLHITLLLLLVWLISFGARYNHLELVAVNSDSLSPYVASMRFWMQGWSDPPNPESDHWMWLTTMPWIWLSDSLYQLFLLRFFWGSLIAPIGALCFFLLAPKNRYLGSAAVGFLLALDKGLIDTLVSSFRGYMAPEFIALESLAIVLNEKGYRYGLFASLFFCIVAAGHHPMALASLAGWFLYALHAKMSLKEWGICFAILFLSSVFRLIWLFEIAQCDAGGLQCFEIIAMGSSETALTIKEMFVRIVHDRFLTEIGWVSICVVIGVYCARKHRITLWLIGGIIGLFCLGVSISTLRPYHFRIFALPMFLAS
ncbi:MAG: hypothetical protein VX278_13400, partial [Myxococcota bacterium]|nr:hypothetical protein [Myxococcota bacterium]